MRKEKKDANRREHLEYSRAGSNRRVFRIAAATAQPWAEGGMPVRRVGRFTVADPDEIRVKLGNEVQMSAPAQIVTNDVGVSTVLKQSISALRRKKRSV